MHRKLPELLRLLCLAALVQAPPASAGRPLFTDDATVTPAGACQAESWVQDNPRGQELNLFPACNFFGDVEITLGLTRRDPGPGASANSYSLQGKKIFREFQPGGWGWGLAIGGIDSPEQNASDVYAYLPLSISLDDDRYQLHLNAGVNHHQPDDDTTLTWGLGGVFNPELPLMVFAEIYGSDDVPGIHGGVGFALKPDRVQLDLTAGRTLRGEAKGNFASIGLNIYLPPF